MKKVLLLMMLLVSIVSAQELFNLEIDLPKTYQSIAAGGEIWFTTKLVNLANKDRIDVILKYEILDIGGQLKASKSETVAVETKASFIGNLKVPKNLGKGLYFLRVILVSPYGESEAKTYFEVIEEQKKDVIIKFSLFDIQITIPDDYQTVHPGGELLTSIKLVNLGGAGRVDVLLDYWIIDSEQNIILKRKETIAVETQSNFIRTFDIPKDTIPGRYQLHTKITYGDDKEAIADHSFEVVKEPINNQEYGILAGLSGTIILIYLILKSKTLFRKIKTLAKVVRKVKRK